jgi:hypothetical protein
MNRRSLLSCLGALAAGTVSPLSAMAEARPPKRRGVLSFESLGVAHADQMGRLHAYLGGTLLPLLDQIHDGRKLVLEAVIAPHTPQAMLLAEFPSFDEMLDVQARVAAHPAARQARQDLESGDVPVLEHVQSQVMLTTGQVLRLPTGFNRLESGILELRSYHAPAGQDSVPARMATVLHRSGIYPIVDASTTAGEHLPRFTYLIPFESLAARQDAWARLDADPEWKDIRRDSSAGRGAALRVTEKSIYKLAPYCQLG